ncbi:MAG TPA: Gfo/Idh/MocA family oxidoreductase [Opitutales bacterium]|nr:Gfo/Idh/MocA family oxidoreductase [Opitutales bacterium]
MPTPSHSSPPRVAVTGLGGYARHHHLKLQILERAGLCRVVATCDPALAQMLPQSTDLNLAARGVQLFPGFEAMLDGMAGAVDAITLPTPIHTHAPLHRACVERGIAVYLEKPPTLWWEELESMITTDTRARYATEVGFNFITEPARAELKARLLAGEFGKLQSAAFLGLWPRPVTYFTRNNWAGKMFRAESPIPLLDSCVGNAMGHYVQNLLNWAGAESVGFATVLDVRSSLYRAHAIQGPDTVFAEARTPEGVTLRFAATHACPQESEGHAEYLFCERAQLRYVTDHACDILWADDRRETIDLRTQGDWQERNFKRFFAYLAGKHNAPVVSLRDCRPFVAWNDLIFAASPGIAQFPDNVIEWLAGKTIPAPLGLTAALRAFAEAGHWPDENKNLPWAREPGRAYLGDLGIALAKIRAMAGN